MCWPTYITSLFHMGTTWNIKLCGLSFANWSKGNISLSTTWDFLHICLHCIGLFWKKIPDTNGEQCNIITELGKCPIYAYWTILYDIWNTKFFSESPNNLLSNEILPDIKYIFTKGSLQDIVNFHGAIFILCQLYIIWILYYVSST